jgi:hypothetical protein
MEKKWRRRTCCARVVPLCVPLPHIARSSCSPPRVLDGWLCGVVGGGGGWSMVTWLPVTSKAVENKWGGVKPPRSCRTVLVCRNEMPTRRVNPPRRVVYSWVVRNNNKSKRNGGRTWYAHSRPSSLFAASRLRWW